MRFVPRKALFIAGGIVALTGLVYLAMWLTSGDQRLALQCAGTIGCVLLALVVVFVVGGELLP